MKESLYIFRTAILAGIAIGLGGYVYLTVGGLSGAVMFAFGLLTVVGYGLPLYTGRAGFFDSVSYLPILFGLVLTGNVVGCYLVSLIGSEAVLAGASGIVTTRIADGLLTNFLLAIPCGFIMTTAVEFAKREESNYLPLLFGVPLFILCGFKHCIADAFYYCCCVDMWSVELLMIWLVTVAGNFIGCNLKRLIAFEK